MSASAGEEALPHRSLLYGGDYARHAVVVVEGPTDAWRVGPGAVATFGVSYTRAQVARLAAYPTRAVIFDSEAGAQERARELCSELRAFPGRTELVEIDARDPGSASKKEVRLIRKAFLE